MAQREQPEQNRGVNQNGQPDTSNDAQRTALTEEEAADNQTGERKGTANRGFAAMDPERQKRIASEGGRAAHKQGVAHEWSKDEAREAGRKGGQIVSRNREHMSEIGRKGGQSSGQKRQVDNPDTGAE